MGYQIIASDLDGTLFDSNGNLSEVNLQAIKQLHEMGIYFVPTTGRAFDEMPAVLQDCPYIRYYINSDGGCLYDKHEDTCYETPMPQQVSQMVLTICFLVPQLCRCIPTPARIPMPIPTLPRYTASTTAAMRL